MDRAMIELWNSVDDDKTVVWHLGDFAFWKIERQPHERLFSQLKRIKLQLSLIHRCDQRCPRKDDSGIR